MARSTKSESEDVRAAQTFYPVMRYNDVGAAVAWLGRVFQFKKEMAVGEPAGKVVFATMSFNNGTIMLSSAPAEDLRLTSPQSLGASTVAVHVSVPDVDAHYEKAVAEGAEIVRPLEDTEHGSRDYNARDPEGHIWAFSTYRP